MPEDQVTAEHAQEYVRLVNEHGHKPGGDTMRKARTNVAERYAGTAAQDAAIETAGGGPEDPVADVATVANTIRRARKSSGGSRGRGSSSGIASLGGKAYGSVSTPGKAAGMVTKLVWAVALGLIVLEVASEATGQYWQFNLPGGKPLSKGSYKPLYKGQDPGTVNPPGGNPQGAPPPGTGSPPDAMPGIFGGTAGANVVGQWHTGTLAGGI